MSHIPKPSSSSQASRPLRSNTDKTHDRLSEVIRKAREEEEAVKAKNKTKVKARSKSLSALEEEEISFDSAKEKPETDSTQRRRSPTPITWEFNFGQEFEDEFFNEPIYILQPVIPIVFRPLICSQMEDYLEDRADLKDGVAVIQALLDKHDPAAPAVAAPLTLRQIKLEIDELQSSKSKIDELKTRTRRLLRGKSDAELNAALGEAKAVIDDWKKAMLKAIEIRDSLEACSVSRVKIPKAEPPSFDGQTTNWPAFLDQFNSMVVNNVKISPTDKLVLLKKSLEKGSAQPIVHNFPLTDLDWTNAWEAVKSRYDHKRELCNAHLTKLFELSPITSQQQTGIRNIIDTVNDVIRAMKNLNIPTGDWDPIIIYIIRKNLDFRTRTDFEKTLPDDKPHNLQVLLDFLNNLATALGSTSSNPKTQKTQDPKKKTGGSGGGPAAPQNEAGASGSRQFKPICSFCNDDHYNDKCSTFVSLSLPARAKKVTEKNVCGQCLRPSRRDHNKNCKAKACGINGCTEKHHALLHTESKAYGAKKEAQTLLSSTSPAQAVTTLLSTAQVNVIHNGRSHKVRVLVDHGSQVNLITDRVANRLQLNRRPSAMLISGVGLSKSSSAHGIVSVKISSCVDSTWESDLDCYVLPAITADKPNQLIDIKTLSQFQNLRLADESFNQPGPVDMLLGIQVFLDILGSHHLKGNPSALETKLGYILGGELDIERIHTAQEVLTCCAEFDLSRFWKQEEVPEFSKLSPAEKDVEHHYAQTHLYDPLKKKFTVELPFIPEHQPLGESRKQAMNRLISLEKRLDRNPDKKVLYHKAMQEYIEEGSIQEVIPEDPRPSPGQVFYLPHHFVEKASSTTKLRVVQDGSAPSASGNSLNSVLRVGPTLQPDLATTLSRFRENKIAFSADIKKMFLQIGVNRKHQDFLRILWRENTKDPVREYRFTCVVFGLASSPYLAMKTLQQLAENEKHSLPLGAEALKEDFYVDDCLSGAQSVQQALDKQKELIQITERGGFHICKWSSNHPALLESVDAKDREVQLPLDFESDEKIKTLGILWDPASDHFTFKVNLSSESKYTKRSVASHAAKTYDPTGLIQPVIIKAKVILQELWESKIGWDETIPESIKKEWIAYYEELPNLERLKIPRHVAPDDPVIVNLHGFSDASAKAIGAVIYVVGENGAGKISSRLLTSKSKVAPLRMVSIPRLELMGAVLLAKLMKNVMATLKTKFREVHYWSDSTSVLGQINKPSRGFKTFVGNRVSYIQEYSEIKNWHHVRTEENPADLVSRGVFPSELLNNNFWWNGPIWLQTKDLPFGSLPEVPPNMDLEEVNKTSVLLTTVEESWADETLKKFNSLKKLKRVTVLLLRRFRPGMQRRRRNAFLTTVEELDLAMKTWIKLVQAKYFNQEIRWLIQAKEFPNTNPIKSLTPFLDSEGVLRVGGRLENAEDLPEDMKHPVILPKNHKLVNLIIDDAHTRYRHAQTQLLTSIISAQYWVVGLKPQVRRFLKSCIICQKATAQIGAQLMGNLPKARLEPTRPFLHTGVDYAGPIKVLPKPGRGQKPVKSWIAVFVCFTTKAVHLELATELSTAAFLAALKRFVSRRGKPKVMYSDEGTNFVGAKNELFAFQEEMLKIANQDEVAASLAVDGISWKLNPPGAPHMGGLWEAAVKSMKSLLKRSMDSNTFTIEEATTLLCEIEACLNSRPLTPMSTNPSDFAVLTPGHFLIGEPLVAVPGHDLTHLKINRLDRFERIQQQKTHFWNRWQSEYLHILQNRPKWKSPSPNFEVGELVLIKDESLAPQKWKVGRIQKVCPGADGKVRVATVRATTVKIVPRIKGMGTYEEYQVQESILDRPIHKLVKLPYEACAEDKVEENDSA